MTSSAQRRRAVAAALALGLGYFGLAALAIGVFIDDAVGVAALWPASGLLVGVLLCTRRESWPALLVAAAIAGVAANAFADLPLGAALGFALVNCATGAIAAMAAIRLAGGRPRIARVRGAMAIVIGAATLANAITALAAAAVADVALDTSFATAWTFWWSSNAVGILALTPVVLVIAGRVHARLRPPPRVVVEFALVIAATIAVSIITYGADPSDPTPLLGFPFFGVALVALAAMRFGIAGATIGSAVLTGVASIGTIAGNGPLADGNLTAAEQLLQLQVFSAVVTGVALTASALLEERAEAFTKLAGERRFAHALVEHLGEGVLATGPDGRISVFNAEARRIFGADPRGEPAKEFLADGAGDGSALAPAGGRELVVALDHGPARGIELRVKPADGSPRIVDATADTILDDDGRTLGAVAGLRDVTVRRGEAEHIAREHRQLEEAERQALVGSWEWELDQNRLTWSAQQYRNHGLEPADRSFAPSLYMRQVHPEDREGLIALGKSLYAEPRRFEVEYRVVHPDGDIRMLACRGGPSDGEVRRLTGSTRDVTAEREVMRVLARQAEVAANMAEGVSMIRASDGRIVYVNSSFERIFGYSSGELTGAHASVLNLDGDDGDFDGLGDIVREHGSATTESRHLRRGGEPIWCRSTTSAFEDAEHGTVWISVTQDVTETRRASEALVETEARFRGAFEHSAVGMTLASARRDNLGALEEVNDALCAITGYDRDELMRLKVRDLFHPDEMDGVRATVGMLLTGELPFYHGEHRLIGAGGSLCWVLISASLVHDAAGKPRHFAVQAQDVTERKRFEGQLEYLADHDSVTGLFNRRRFEAELERELAAAARYARTGAVLMLDLDDFKYVNDAFGHAVGDEMLNAVARSLHSALRSTDVLARLGGDEFGIVLPQSTRQQALEVGEKLCRVVRAEALAHGLGDARKVTVSVGVTTFGGRTDEPTPEELVLEADLAMYDAKEAGRDRVAAFRPDSNWPGPMSRRGTWVERIREALRECRFVLHAQPILALLDENERPRSELLIRMIEPGGDLVPPGTFLYIAERFGMIGEIDRWVIDEAIRLLAEQQEAGNDVVFEVNISAKSLDDRDLLAAIEAKLAESGVDPSGLVFEMTETEAIVNIARARAFAQRLRDLGCGFALDDFGAGFASFYYLKHLAFDYLKIDGEFIENLPTDHTDQMVVRAVVGIARGMGKRTIAEFVGDAETLTLLRELGVDFAQGYYVGRPRPIGESTLDAQPVVDRA